MVADLPFQGVFGYLQFPPLGRGGGRGANYVRQIILDAHDDQYIILFFIIFN